MPRQPRPVPPSPVVTETGVTFRLADADRDLAGVRLWQEVRIPRDRLDFTWRAGRWSLRIDRPPVDRMEYLFELARDGRDRESVTDPGNPLRVSGAFGDKSVVEFAEYVAPRWLREPAPDGRSQEVVVRPRSIRGPVTGRLWSPADSDDDEPLPLLVAHDGPEYDELSGLTTYLSASIASGALPPMRAALLAPGPRDDRYSANGAYTRALCLSVVPHLRRIAPSTAIVGMGASLGALAMLHAHRRYPDTFDGLFLQSGSFFHPRFDAHERRFGEYDRVVRTVDLVLRAGSFVRPVPVALTCGGIEENVENNRTLTRALVAQGYDAALTEVRDMHNYVAWRDAFDPHLTQLLSDVVTATADDPRSATGAR